MAYDEYAALMQRCWADDPEERPNFEQVGCRAQRLSASTTKAALG